MIWSSGTTKVAVSVSPAGAATTSRWVNGCRAASCVAVAAS